MNLINFYGFLLSWLKEWEDWLGLLYLWFVNKYNVVLLLLVNLKDKLNVVFYYLI